MKNILLAFSLITIIIAGCSDSGTGTKPPEKGTRIGAWMVYNQKAVWVGGKNNTYVKTSAFKVSTDTITVNSPNLRGLILYRINGGAIISYIDSVYSDLPAMGTVDTMRANIIPTDMYQASKHSTGIAYGNDKKRVAIDFTVKKVKDSGVEPTKFLVTVGDATKLRTFLFNVTGLDSAYSSIKLPYLE